MVVQFLMLENEDIFLVGIKENGFEIAKIIMNEIEKISWYST